MAKGDPHAARTAARKAARLAGRPRKSTPKVIAQRLAAVARARAAYPSTRPMTDRQAERMWLAHWARFPDALRALLTNMADDAGVGDDGRRMPPARPHLPKGQPQDDEEAG